MRETLAQYGGITVMIPAALVIAVWLWYSRPLALKWWLVTVASTYSIVAFSKLLFKGWGVALQSLDIAVISGHAMNTSLMVTVGLGLVARRINPQLRWPVAALGVALTGAFSAFCIAPYIHPLNEALAGWMLGSAAALAFLWRLEMVDVKVSPSLIGGGVVILLLCALVPKYNAEKLLNHVAIAVSGAERAYHEPPWREASGYLDDE
ncbi:hypothetical protein ACW9H6_02125 [Pseudomonas sp. SDO528_S397]